MEQEIHAINKAIEVLAVPTDLIDAKAIASLWEKVERKFGHADVLINNAGSSTEGTIADIQADAWWADFVGVHSLSPSTVLISYRRLTSEGHFLIPKLS